MSGQLRRFLHCSFIATWLQGDARKIDKRSLEYSATQCNNAYLLSIQTLRVQSEGERV